MYVAMVELSIKSTSNDQNRLDKYSAMMENMALIVLLVHGAPERKSDKGTSESGLSSSATTAHRSNFQHYMLRIIVNKSQQSEVIDFVLKTFGVSKFHPTADVAVIHESIEVNKHVELLIEMKKNANRKVWSSEKHFYFAIKTFVFEVEKLVDYKQPYERFAAYSAISVANTHVISDSVVVAGTTVEVKSPQLSSPTVYHNASHMMDIVMIVWLHYSFKEGLSVLEGQLKTLSNTFNVTKYGDDNVLLLISLFPRDADFLKDILNLSYPNTFESDKDIILLTDSDQVQRVTAEIKKAGHVCKFRKPVANLHKLLQLYKQQSDSGMYYFWWAGL